MYANQMVINTQTEGAYQLGTTGTYDLNSQVVMNKQDYANYHKYSLAAAILITAFVTIGLAMVSVKVYLVKKFPSTKTGPIRTDEHLPIQREEPPQMNLSVMNISSPPLNGNEEQKGE